MANTVKGVNGSELLALAKSVSAAANRLSIYYDEGREPPARAEEDLALAEEKLDGAMAKRLSASENLKEEIAGLQVPSQEVGFELERSYRRAACVKEFGDKSSRLFFLPFLYVQEEDGARVGLIDFTPERIAALKGLLAQFVNRRLQGMESGVEIRLYPKVICDCVIGEDEEKNLPKLHEAAWNEKARDLSGLFKQHAEMVSAAAGTGNSGWSLGTIAFCIGHENLEALEMIDFADFAEDFEEQFEEIFDPSSQNDYRAPIDPIYLTNEAIRLLWEKQLQIASWELAEYRKKGQDGHVEAAFFMDGEEFAELGLEFWVGPDKEKSPFRKSISRPALANEQEGDLAALLCDYEPLRKRWVKISLRRADISEMDYGEEDGFDGEDD